MAATMKLISFLLLATLAAVSLAVPPQAIHHRVTDPILATPTRDAMPSVCTNGMPASKQHPAGYPINDYTVVTPGDSNWTSYEVKQDWYNDHFVSGPHIMSFTHQSEPYGPFKCQYTCNSDDSCAAYFVWYANVGTDNEHLNCVLFDAVIPTSAFIETTGTIASGAYDKLCDHSS
ncbi:uncharacterized protein B0H64DRAFT_372610 [Chaetomium fimeti]|uniref:Apple domain-containing protein n=1 Tax=Chaetomium fimeti TaxID=1854472 RepID=A0AAE0HIN0_9PEZI|nr:hypothetical protein B0H64DRAFT_372610 [Chaetomium fimeti]